MSQAKQHTDVGAEPKPLFPLSPDAIRRLLGLDPAPQEPKPEAN